jgi:D-xylose 1-dehydrogenase (NADP+, D-xylono-1,5-lactone-forming)
MDAGRIGWGVLSSARVTRRRFLPALQEAGNGYLLVVGSRSLNRAAAVVQAVGQGKAAGSYEEVLEDTAVDAVYIALPNSLHELWTRKALAAGKHVLCEKPLALRAAAVEELADASVAARRVVMEGLMYRLHPQYEPAVWQPLVEQIGPLRSADVRMSYPFDRQGDIRENAALGGGALWDIGCYCLDILAWQLGEPVEVRAMGDLQDGLDWTTSAQLRFASGVLATAWWSFAGPLSQRLSLVGRLGTLELDSPFRAYGPAGAWLDTGGGARWIELATDNCFRREIEHLGDVILGSAAPAVPLADSARWLQVAEAVDQQVRGMVPATINLRGTRDAVESSRAPADLRERVGQPRDRGCGAA